MLRYVFADQLDQFPTLRDSMFRDRADQFKTRLNWDVNVDENGFERDEYDDANLNPLYVIWETPQGTHSGSMRLLPTTGRCMVNEHFLDLMGGDLIQNPTIWECTRFCLSRAATRLTANAFMLAGGEVMVGFGVKQCVGVFDQRMIRIYRMIGAQPKILGQSGEGKDFIGVGVWSFSDDLRQRVAKIAGISPTQSRKWFDLAFGEDQRLAQVG
jgi:N-acyl-L-homoserine lactone synthetase